MIITNNGFLATITVESDLRPGDRPEVPSIRTAFSKRRFKEPEVIPVDPIEGLDLRMCISAGAAYVYAEAKEQIPAGTKGAYFLRTGEHNVEISLKSKEEQE